MSKSPEPPHEILRAFMKSTGLSQEEFARTIGFHGSHLTRLFQGKITSVSAQLAYAVELAFGQQFDALELLTAQSRWQLDKIAQEGLPDRRNPKHGNRVNLDGNAIETAYRKGDVTIAQLAEEHHVSYGTILRLLIAREVPLESNGPRVQVPRKRSRRQLDPIPLRPDGTLDETAIIARYQEGYGVDVVAAACEPKVHGTTINRLLRRRNIEIRSPNQRGVPGQTPLVFVPEDDTPART